MKNKYIAAIEAAQIASNKTFTVTEEDKQKNRTTRTVERSLAPFQVGDTIDVHQRILDGEKERIQIFSGVVISRKGTGIQESFTVRRIVQSEGVERVFPLHSTKIAKIEVKKTGKVRRAKLYYLRDRVGKATRVKERDVKPTKASKARAAKAAAAAAAAAGTDAAPKA